MKRFIVVLFSMVLAISSVFGNAAMPLAETTDAEREFDYVNVLDDLTRSTEGENAFDITDYPYNENGRVQLITLVEYCYSYAANMRDNYALYLYIYNPTGKTIYASAELNKATFAVSYDSEGLPDDYEKFNLVFCNKSTGDYNNLFYKFRVEDHASADGKTIGERVNSNLRRYDLSEVELLSENGSNAEPYGVGGTYKFSGYAQGYGPDESAASTLTCEVTDLETIESTVTGTVYRPEGNYYQGEQEQLNSVFFSVPEYFFAEYGEISSIEAEWYEYKTNPILITENAELAKIYSEYVGIDITTTDFEDYFWATKTAIPDGLLTFEWLYNHETEEDIEQKNILSAVFDTNGGSYENFSIKEYKLIEEFLTTSERLGGELINGKYSEVLFSDSVDAGHVKGHRQVEIDSDAMFSLTTYYLTKNFWQKIFGGSTLESKTYEDIQAIIIIDAEDLEGTDAEVAKRLYIGETEVEALRDEYAVAQSIDNPKKLVLFRYATSTYEARDVVFHVSNYNNTGETETVAGCAYASEQTVYLDFDIIETTFYKKGVYTSIPVVAAPIDVFGPVTPPLDNEYKPQESGCNDATAGVKIVIAVVIIAAVAIILTIGISIINKGGNSEVKVTYSPPKEDKKGQAADNTLKRIELAATRTEKYAKQSAESAKKIQKEVNKNASKKGNNQKSSSKQAGGSKGSKQKSASSQKSGANKNSVQAGGKTQGKNSNARGGKTDGKAKGSKGKRAKVQGGKGSVSDKKLRGGNNAKR